MGSAVLRLRARLCWRIFPYRREAVLKTVRAQAFASGCALLSDCSQNFRQIAVAFRKVHSERLQKSGEQNFDGALFGSKRLRAPTYRSTKRARGGVFAGHLHIPDQLGLCAKKNLQALECSTWKLQFSDIHSNLRACHSLQSGFGLGPARVGSTLANFLRFALENVIFVNLDIFLDLFVLKGKQEIFCINFLERCLRLRRKFWFLTFLSWNPELYKVAQGQLYPKKIIGTRDGFRKMKKKILDFRS